MAAIRRQLGRRTIERSNGRETEAKLIAIAARMFRTQGFAATKTRALSAELGMQNASLYHYISKKEDLLLLICMNSLEAVHQMLSRCVAENSDPLERLVSIIKEYVHISLRDRDEHATMLTEIRSLSRQGRATVIKKRDENVAVVRDCIQDAQAARQLRNDIPPRHLTLALLNLLNWTIFWYQPGGELTASQIADMLRDVFLNGALPDGRRANQSASRRER